MRCNTCGEHLEAGVTHCPTCGAPTPRLLGRTANVRRCPRCGYWGQGVSYFSRPGHIAVLAGLSLFTYGIGGLTYWLVCRKRRICPSCGLGWESSTRLLSAPQNGALPRPLEIEPPKPLPGSGIGRRVTGVLALLMAALMIVMGVIELEAAMIAVGGVMGAGGSLSFLWGYSALQNRRKAVLKSMERRVLLLAQEKGGQLTVSEVATELDLSLQAAEKVLMEMDDGFRVRSEVTESGLLLYEFPELKYRNGLPPTPAAERLPPARPAPRPRPPEAARTPDAASGPDPKA
ncbi:MAG: hypothetical protein R3E98_06015 [Gemmatimonadota bacterium]|nr:hypothetical protein [Gemmatimonadota bacterium]